MTLSTTIVRAKNGRSYDTGKIPSGAVLMQPERVVNDIIDEPIRTRSTTTLEKSCVSKFDAIARPRICSSLH